MERPCENCDHSDVCGYKKLMDEIIQKVGDSGAYNVSPFATFTLGCLKFKPSEMVVLR